MKRLRLVIEESSVFDDRLTFKLPEGGSIRDAITEAGFRLGEHVIVTLDPDATQPAVES